MRIGRQGIVAVMLVLLGASPAAAAEALILKKEEVWGPCPTNAVCRQTTELFATGRLVKTGQFNSKEQVGPMAVERVLGAIRRSGIMKKDCPASVVVDYGAEYQFNVDGQSRVVKFPACEAELKKIAEALEPPVMPREIPEPVSERDEAVEFDPRDDDPFF